MYTTLVYQLHTYMYDFWSEYHLFRNSVISIPHHSVNIRIPNKIYRVREFNAAFLDNTSQLGYIPKALCKRTGRANIPNYPVFYGSFSQEVAMNEFYKTQKTPPEKIILSTWEFDSKVKYNTVMFAIEGSPGEKTTNKLFDYSHEKLQQLAIETHPSMLNDTDKKGLSWRYLEDLKQTAALFLEDDYFASAIVAYEILYKTRFKNEKGTIDAIVYPSIVDVANANIAVHPSLQDNNLLRLTDCTVIDR